MTETRAKAIKMYWKIAKEKCPFQTEKIVNGYLEGFIDCAEYLLLRNTDLEKENADLKADNDARKFAMAMSEKVEKQLREENAELKKELEISRRCWQDQKNISLEANCSLYKAKEIIRDFISVAIDYIDKEDKNYSYIVEAEQFLNIEVEK